MALTDESAEEASLLVNGFEVGNTANVERLEQVQSEEASNNGAIDRCLVIDSHGPVLAIAVEFDGVPLAQLEWLVGADDGRTGTDVEAELRIPIVDAERDEVATAAGLLAVVQDETVGRLRLERHFDVELHVGVG